MKFSSTSFIFFSVLLSASVLLLNSCSPGLGSSGKNNTASVAAATFTGQYYPNLGAYSSNTEVFYVNSSTTCGANYAAYYNFPCVSVTICAMATPTNCQTINNILLDTGSFGLRLFKSVISSSVLSGLVPVTSGSNLLGECVTYGDGSSDWGQVMYAYIALAGEPMVGVPIQVINQSFGTPPSPCQSPNSTPDTSPTSFNGILGVGVLAQDCGSSCVSSATVGAYYTCAGSNCNSGAYVALSAQVTNPVSALGVDGNGIIISLNAVGTSGAVSVSGDLTFGINGHTAAPNIPSAVIGTSSGGQFITNAGSGFNSVQSNWLAGFLDTGSNFIYFPSTMNNCAGAYSSFYCPASSPTTFTYSNTNYPAENTTSVVTFNISNFLTVTAANPTYNVFSNLAGGSLTSLAGTFDWGLPFFYGKTVYVGINGASANMVVSGISGDNSYAGPFFAY